MALKFSSLPLESKTLVTPALEELQAVLETGLLDNYREVSVKIVDCPNLQEPPFDLACPGIGGKTRAVDLGGAPYLVPLVHREKLYDLINLPEALNIEPLFVLGCACGPFPWAGRNCEGFYNLGIHGGQVQQKSLVSIMNTDGTNSLLSIPANETRCAVLGNFFISKGAPGKVLRIHAKQRKGPYDFPASIRATLKGHYRDRVLGLGGVFLIKEGKVKHHVMDDFSSVPLYTSEDIHNWLHFFEWPAPLTAVGYLLSGDVNLDARRQHFHSFSGNQGGHYVIDTTPNEVEYLAYFNTVDSVVRIDRPTDVNTMVGAIFDDDDDP